MTQNIKGQSKGKDFELKIQSLLEALRIKYPNYIRYTYQPKLELSTGQLLIPDFELQIKLPFVKMGIMIECQDRKRNSTEIAHKIRHAKSLSSRNLFVFVYSESVSTATKKVLQADGVLLFSLLKFEDFLHDIGRSIINENDDPPPRRPIMHVRRRG